MVSKRACQGGGWCVAQADLVEQQQKKGHAADTKFGYKAADNADDNIAEGWNARVLKGQSANTGWFISVLGVPLDADCQQIQRIYGLYRKLSHGERIFFPKVLRTQENKGNVSAEREIDKKITSQCSQ